MAKVPDLIPIIDFRQGAALALTQVQRSVDPAITTQREGGRHRVHSHSVWPPSHRSLPLPKDPAWDYPL